MKDIKENDIRPKALMEQKAWAVDADKNFLLQRYHEFVESSCPACDSQTSSHWGSKGGFTYRQCDYCKTQFTSPRPTEKILDEFYRQSSNYELWNSSIFPATETARKKSIFIPRAQRTVDLCRNFGINGGTILEIGAAFGTYCDAIKDTNYFETIIAVEPTPALASTCRSKGIVTYEETVEKLTFPTLSADVVAAFEVIEHLFSPFDFISRVATFLRAGGLFIGSCPNGLSLGTLTVREEARCVDHEHISYFNPDSIAILLKRAGMELLEVSTPGELDVDILINQLKESPYLQIHSPVVEKLLANLEPLALSQLQELIRQAKISSHMWFVAKKK